MTYQMALLESKLDGLAEGRNEGREEERISIALNMLKDGLPFDQIQKFTKLTLDKIKELAKKKIDWPDILLDRSRVFFYADFYVKSEYFWRFTSFTI